MDAGSLKKKLFKEWTCLVLSFTGALLCAMLLWFYLPGTIPVEFYIKFYDRTGLNLGDFVFFGVIISVYLVRAIAWALEQIYKK